MVVGSLRKVHPRFLTVRLDRREGLHGLGDNCDTAVNINILAQMTDRGYSVV